MSLSRPSSAGRVAGDSCRAARWGKAPGKSRSVCAAKRSSASVECGVVVILEEI